MYAIWPVMKKCTSVVKRELFATGPMALSSWLGGIYFIKRDTSDATLKLLKEATTLCKDKNLKMWVFPEGTRRNTGQLHTFKKGAFRMAIDSQIPILPVVFSSYQTFLDDEHKQFNGGRVIVTTLPPIQTTGLTTKDVDSLLQRTHDAMNKAYISSTEEMEEEATMYKLHNRRCSIAYDYDPFEHRFTTFRIFTYFAYFVVSIHLLVTSSILGNLYSQN